MFRLRRSAEALAGSSLFDQKTFYRAFVADLERAKEQVVIESPFITAKRMRLLMPVLHRLAGRGVRIAVNTRPPEEHDGVYRLQAEETIEELQKIGATVLLTVGHHRKIAIIDSHTIWEGSLNILSYSDSCEVMRRIYSEQAVKQMLLFLKLDEYIDDVV